MKVEILISKSQFKILILIKNKINKIILNNNKMILSLYKNKAVKNVYNWGILQLMKSKINNELIINNFDFKCTKIK